MFNSKTISKVFIVSAVAAFAMFSAITAQAATLSISGGNTTYLSSEFGLSESTGLSVGTAITVFDSTSDGPDTGLMLTGAPIAVTFEGLGGTESYDNRYFEIFATEGSTIQLQLNNGGGLNNPIDVVVSADGAMPFLFDATGFCGRWFCYAHNDGNIEEGLMIGFYQESAKSVIALFGNNLGANDFDSAMALRISVIPLPSSILLFGGALIGLGWISRRRKNPENSAPQAILGQ